MTANQPLPTSGGSTSRRAPEAQSREVLLRDAARLLDAAGVTRSASWLNRTVRTYMSARIQGLLFGDYLVARVELNVRQRRWLEERADLRYLLTYADPTGENAARNVDRGRF